MTTTDPFTTAARAEAERRTRPPGISGQTLPSMEQFAERDGYRRGFADAAEWARSYLAAQEPTDAAQIIDEHRVDHRAVGFGVTVKCTCGHESYGELTHEMQTAEQNPHRDADRKHAAHVADMLIREDPTR